MTAPFRSKIAPWRPLREVGAQLQQGLLAFCIGPVVIQRCTQPRCWSPVAPGQRSGTVSTKMTLYNALWLD
jgi:hypothetical protein